jgi:DNA repair photolyase
MANTGRRKDAEEIDLFPILDGDRPSRGLVKMTEAAETAGSGHLVEYRALSPKSILNRSISKRRLSLAYSINPYRGCEFGCRYCYARYTHEFMVTPNSPEGESTALQSYDAFERRIFLKKNAAWLLEQELRYIDRRDEIALGTATDPYQPLERREEVTRSLLEVFARKEGYRLGIVTKSQLILRDRDLLAKIAERNTLVVHCTITTTDAELARKLEPRAPRPDLRFEAVRGLREAGIRTGVLCSPLLPGITDMEASVDRVARRAKQADASFLAGEPLFLKSCSRPTYLSFVREHFPALEAEYANRFAHAEFASTSYRLAMAELMSRVCARYGIPERSTDALLTRDAGGKPPMSSAPASSDQQLLFG